LAQRKKQAKPRKPHNGGLAQHFHHLAALHNNQDLTVGLLLNSLGSRSASLITFILGLPFLLPIPLPGLSIILGIVIAFVGFSIVLGQTPWIPKRLLKRRIHGAFMKKFLFHAERFTRKLERYVRPRGSFLANHRWISRFNGLLIVIGGLLLMLPLPPGTNFPPALIVVLLSVGVLEEDGLFVLLGYVAFALNVLFFGALWKLGYEGLKRLFF
jgi:hypothetical protein